MFLMKLAIRATCVASLLSLVIAGVSTYCMLTGTVLGSLTPYEVARSLFFSLVGFVSAEIGLKNALKALAQNLINK